METTQQAKTLTGVKFEYSGSLKAGLVIYKGDYSIPISKTIIDIIKLEIQRRSPVLMGANRDKPIKYSIGESLRNQRHSPQNLSYVIPLLIEEGFCKVNNKKPFVITII